MKAPEVRPGLVGENTSRGVLDARILSQSVRRADKKLRGAASQCRLCAYSAVTSPLYLVTGTSGHGCPKNSNSLPSSIRRIIQPRGHSCAGPSAKPAVWLAVNSVGPLLERRRSAPRHPGGGGDRVSGTDADRHDDISHNGSSGFGGNADSAETTDLRPCKSRLQRCRGVGLNSSFSLPSANLPRPSMAGAFFRSCPGWMR
jgi:hypothetical protein